MPYTATLQLRAKVQPSIKFKAKVQPNIKIKAQGLGEMISVRVSLSSTTFLNRGAVAFSPYSLFTFGTQGVWFDPSDAANLDWQRNLLTFSRDPFAGVSGIIAKADAGITAPTGDQYVRFTELSGATSGKRFFSQNLATFAGNMTFSFYAKENVGGRWISFRENSTTGFAFAFQPSTGTVSTYAGGASPANVFAQLVAAGVYRVSFVINFTAPTSRNYSLDMIPGAGQSSLYVGDGVSGFDVTSVQLELGSVATDYQRITDLNTEVLERFPNTTLYQDPPGTTPVTTPGQTVGLMLDKSKGLVIGPELVVNGNFDTDTIWFKSTGWTISSGAANANVTSFSGISQNISAQIGKTYVVYVTANVTSGAVAVGIGNSGQNVQAPISTSGVYRFIITPRSDTASGNIYFRGNGVGGAFVGSIDNVSAKELPGNHAVQETLAARPTYAIEPAGGRRNRLTWTEQFNNAAWTLRDVSTFGSGSVANTTATLDPIGGYTADFIRENTQNNLHTIDQNLVLTAAPYTASFYCKAATRTWAYIRLANAIGLGAYFNLSNGTIGTVESGMTAAITPAGNGWYRCSVTTTANATGWYPSVNIALGDNQASYTGDNASGIYIWGAQLELGSTATPYQRVTTQYDVTEAGKPTMSYLYFDGVNDSMVTSTITPGTDKVQVFAGLRKLNDVTGGVVAEPGIGNLTGTFQFYAGDSATAAGPYWTFGSKGTLDKQAITGATFPAPRTNVLTGLGDIGGSSVTLRANGVQVAQTIGSQGTGNFLAYPIYIGARAGTNLFFTGHFYSFITRFGANLDTPSITSTESWVASKTGFYSPVITGVPTVGVS